MPHWKTVIINRFFLRHLVKLLKLSLLKLKLHTLIFACHCWINHITFFEVIEVNQRTLSTAEVGTHLTDNWKPESSLSARDMNPGPRYQPADKEEITLTIGPR